MKKLTVFVLKRCPYCIKAKKYIDELIKEDAYKQIEIEFVDERKEKKRASDFDYYYVPSFYMGDHKLYEGAIKKEQLKEVFDDYLQRLNDE